MPVTKVLFALQSFHLFILHLTLRPLARWILKLAYGLHHENRQVLPGIGKPYLLLGDHVSYLDPFVIGGCVFMRPVRWIAADGNFRNPLMGFLFSFVAGAIAKTKNHSDMQSLMKMKLIAQQGGIIGLFPEGEMSWDGKGLDMVQGTDKLVRFLKIPVYYAHLEGVYQTRPRWSPKARRRTMTVRYKQIISAEEVEKLNLTQIRQRIEEAIDYDEYALQIRQGLPLDSQRRAEYMERFLYTCPKCRSINTLQSQGNQLSCHSCNWTMVLDERGIPTEDIGFTDFAQWNLWQQDLLLQTMKANRGEALWEDSELRLFRGQMKRRARQIFQGPVRLFMDRIEFFNDQETLDIPLNEVTGLNVFKAQYVEFLYNKMQYRMDFCSPHSSGVKWYHFFNHLQDLIKENKAKERNPQ